MRALRQVCGEKLAHCARDHELSLVWSDAIQRYVKSLRNQRVCMRVMNEEEAWQVCLGGDAWCTIICANLVRDSA